MRVLLISTYELGHQPLHLGSPAAALVERGHEVRCIDTAVDTFDPRLINEVDAVAISVPMHTAMRLALDVAAMIRARRPDRPICFYGLYAGVASDHVLATLADRVIAGEYEHALCAWLDGSDDDTIVQLARHRRFRPSRSGLPPLAKYAKLLVGDEERLAAAVQASHGCSSRCRHCPVPAVYDGRVRIVDPAVVLDDIAEALSLGARHITFADPDFLNGPHHSVRIVRAMHERFPDVTFDMTTKVELILRYRHLWPEFANAGCLFVTTAVECVDDTVLAILDKGHTAADAAHAIVVLRDAGIEPRPSLLPFTPWTTLDGLADLVDFAIVNDLVRNVDPVHWTIRLLVPDGSLLRNRPELVPYLDGYDPNALGWRWRARDPRVDALQCELVALVEAQLAIARDETAIFELVADRVATAAERTLPKLETVPQARPRLSESWFCCAEPTCEQRTRTVRASSLTHP
jgi:radical SAM superfamily enzyme YgiQ (UPF0313 family)